MESVNRPEMDHPESGDFCTNVALVRAPLTRQNILSVFDNEFWNDNERQLLKRSTSNPGCKTPDWNARRQNTKQQPSPRTRGRPSDWNKDKTPDNQDTRGGVKDTNLNLNPWVTYRRAPANININATPPVKPKRSELHNVSDGQTVQGSSVSYTNSAVTGKVLRQPANREQDNFYGTYRRAPRTTDFRNKPDLSNPQSGYQNPVYEDDDYLEPASRPQPLNNDNTIVPIETVPNGHKPVDKQTSIKHLFNVKLNDIKKNNLHESGKSTKRQRIQRFVEGRRKRFGEFLSSLRTSKSPKEGVLAKTRNGLRRLKRSKSDDKRPDTNTTPSIFFRLITKYPKTSFFITLSGHLLVAIVTMLLLLSGFDLFPTDFEVLPVSDYNVPWRKRDLAWRFRDESEDRYVRKWAVQGAGKWPRYMAYGRANIVLYYDKEDGNVFEKSTLKRMKYIEDRITQTSVYKNSLCVHTSKYSCQPPLSVLRLFDGSYSFIDPLFNDTEFKNITGVLHAAMSHNFVKNEVAYFLSKDHYITRRHTFASVTRTIIPVGYPLELGEKLETREHKMEEYLQALKPTIEDLVKSSSEVRVTYWSYLLFKLDLIKQATSDLLLAIGSVSFIFCFVVYHTKSLWVSTLAVSSILTSFLCTNLIYRIILDYRYFGHFHIIAVFIILGIGADDLFVFLDVWKMTEFKSFPSLAHRLSAAYRTAVISMFFTSLTTAVAFFASAISPQLAINSFGVFAGLLVIVNYISVIVFFPNVVIMHHVYFKDWSWPCIEYVSDKILQIYQYVKTKFSIVSTDTSKKHTETNKKINRDLFEDNTVIGSAGNVYDVVGEINLSYKPDHVDEYGFLPGKDKNKNIKDSLNKFTNERNQTHQLENKETATVKNAAIESQKVGDDPEYCNLNETIPKAKSSKVKKKLLIRFFSGYYYRFVTHKLFRWIIISGLLATVGFFAYSVSKLETDSDQIQFYRKSHNYGRAMDLELHGFVANKNDRNVVVYIVWGLEERDMSVCHFSDGRCHGVQQYDPTFDPNTPEAQIALREFCHRLLNMSPKEIDHYKIRRDFATGELEIQCFADSLDKFFKAKSRRDGINHNLPWDYRKTITFMQSNGNLYTTAKFDKSFNQYLEIPISYWLNDGYRFKNMTDFHRFHTLIGEQTGNHSTALKTDFSVFYGNRIRYLGIQVNLTLGTFSTGYSEGRPIMDRWEKFIREEMAKMPTGLKRGFQLTKDFWHTVSMQKSMRDNAIFGIGIGIGLALPILTAATGNILIGFFATFCMCCSTVCVIGVIPLAGWKLGVLESLNMCMVVGLTVDYVVHLAEGYHISTNSDRMLRTRDMLEVMGISVFSGACTTLGASLFMFFAQILFFVRFGVFMFCTIGFSLVFSLGLFTTIMGVAGPSGTTGDVKVIAQALCVKAGNLKNWIQRNKSNDKNA